MINKNDEWAGFAGEQGLLIFYKSLNNSYYLVAILVEK
jgi:hypothetical protein